MKFILGRKLHMTQLFDEQGRVTPVTVVSAVPNVVTTVKTTETDGYSAVQLGLEEQKTSRLSRAVVGALGGKGYKILKEFRLDEAPTLTAGDTLTVDTFVKGDTVTVTGTSKSKGFQGVVKRHGFGGGPRSHGQKHSEREPGSIGGGLRTRVPKGMRMAGRMGGGTVTVQGLKVVAVDAEENKLYVSGAIPGRRGTVIAIMSK